MKPKKILIDPTVIGKNSDTQPNISVDVPLEVYNERQAELKALREFALFMSSVPFDDDFMHTAESIAEHLVNKFNIKDESNIA